MAHAMLRHSSRQDNNDTCYVATPACGWCAYPSCSNRLLYWLVTHSSILTTHVWHHKAYKGVSFCILILDRNCVSMITWTGYSYTEDNSNTILQIPNRHCYYTFNVLCCGSHIGAFKSVAFSPQANYTDWATATCRRNLVPIFVDRWFSHCQCGGSPTVVNISFLDRSRYFSFK
jgi:hypothetical protein